MKRSCSCPIELENGTNRFFADAGFQGLSRALAMLLMLCLLSSGLVEATFSAAREQLDLNGTLFASAADEFIAKRNWIPAEDCNPGCAANNTCCKVRHKANTISSQNRNDNLAWAGIVDKMEKHLSHLEEYKCNSFASSCRTHSIS